MMTSTCNGINNSVSSLSCSSSSSSIQLLNDMEQLIHAWTSVLLQMNLWNIKISSKRTDKDNLEVSVNESENMDVYRIIDDPLPL